MEHYAPSSHFSTPVLLPDTNPFASESDLQAGEREDAPRNRRLHRERHRERRRSRSSSRSSSDAQERSRSRRVRHEREPPSIQVHPPEAPVERPRASASPLPTPKRRNHDVEEEDFKKLAKAFREAQRRELPKQGSREAPETWSGRAAELPKFFRDLEDLFDDYLVDERDQVKVLLRYVDTVPEGVIRGMEAYRSRDYPKLKSDLAKLMGPKREQDQYRMADLNTLVQELSKRSFRSEIEYETAYLRFLQMSQWLMRKRKLGEEERDLKFWDIFSPRLQQQLKTRLAVKLPDHPRADPYPMSAVHEAACYILDDSAFDRRDLGDSRTWLERQRNSARLPNVDRTASRRRSPSPASSVSDSKRSSSPDSLPANHRQHSRVRWDERDSPSKPKASLTGGDNLEDLLDRMGKLSIDDPEYRRGYVSIQARFPVVAAHLRPPSSANISYRPSMPSTSSNRTDCFYCGRDGCRMGTCPTLKDHLQAGIVKPDPGNPKFVVYKDGSRLYPLPVGGRAGDAEHRLLAEQRGSAPVARQANIIKLGDQAGFAAAYIQHEGSGTDGEACLDKGSGNESSDLEEVVRRTLEAVRAKSSTRSGKPYERTGDRKRGRDKQATEEVVSEPAGAQTTKSPARDEAMAEFEPKRSKPTAQYRYSSKAESAHRDEDYLNKVLDLPLSGPHSSIRLRDLIGSSLPLRKGLVEYLRTQRVPLEAQVTPAIVAALGVPEPLFHARLERFVVRIAGRDIVVLKDEGSEINLIHSRVRKLLGLPLDTQHRITMEGVNPGARRSEGLCENVIVATGGVEMRVHLHVFDESPFDILLGQPWKSQYLVQERRQNETLEMTVRDYRDTSRQVAVVLRDFSDPSWDSRLDSLQLPRTRKQPPDPDARGQTSSVQRFDRQPEGVRPGEWDEEDSEEWEGAKAGWAQSCAASYKSRYKPVARKVRPVDGILPDEARTTRRFPEDPLVSLPELPTKPPPMAYGSRLTEERWQDLDIGKGGFLWPEEIKLFSYILLINEMALAFDESEKGRFRDDYFSPYRIATIPHEPWQEKPIPIAPGVWPKVLDLVKQKLSNGTYEWSQSSYRGRIFPVMKKDGSPRIVHDMQKLNAVTIRDSTLPPNIEDVVESFAGRACYTVFDIFVGYDNRTLAAESRDLTSFLVPGFGLLRLTSLPMGATNAMAEFQACMTFILQSEIPDQVAVFVDDCAVKGPSTRYETEGSYEVLEANQGIRRFIWEHAQVVHRVLHRIGHAGATVSAPKLQLAVSEVHLLGSVCTYEGRLPDESKISKIRNWPECRTTSEVRGFLGTCGVVRAWIRNFATVSRPLAMLLRGNQLWQWGQEQREAMQRLKDLVTDAPCLAPLDCETMTETILAVDSSNIAVGFILYQSDAEGRRRPIRFGSLTFNERESRYSQPKLELYGLYRALRKWRPYVVSVRKLVVEVDALYIRGMLNSPELAQNAIVGRWVEEISTYPFTLRHVRAAQHTAPDGLSRRPRAPEDTDSEESGREQAGESRIVAAIRLDGWAGDSFRSYGVQHSDLEPELEAVRSLLRDLRAPGTENEAGSRAIVRKAKGFFLLQDRLWRRRPDGQHQLVVPVAEREHLLAQTHDQLGHKGAWSTSRQLLLRVWWPGIEHDAAEYTKTCKQCQLRAPRNVHLPIRVSHPRSPFQRLHADVVFFPKAHGYIAAVLVRDDLTGYIEGRPLRKVSSRAVGAFLWEEVLTRWGAVDEIVTDNGVEFKGAVEALTRRYEVNQIRISAYNKQANGVIERGHRTFREALLRSCDKTSDWPNQFHAALWAERVTIRKATGYSPYFLAHGNHPLLPFDISESTFLFGDPKPMSTQKLVARRIRMLARLESAIEDAKDRLTRSRYRSKAQFERAHAKTLRTEPLPPGTPVLVRNSRFDSEINAKSHDRWLGPYIVVRVGQNGAYRLAELDGAVLTEAIAASRIVEFYPRQKFTLKPEEVLDGTGWERAWEEDSQLNDDEESIGSSSEDARI